MAEATIEAGEELDEFIATKVMGLTLCPERVVIWSISGIWNSWKCPHPDLDHYGQGELPNYSTTIAGAWLVVEKLGLWVFPWKNQWFAGLLRESHWAPYVDVDLGVMDFSFSALESADTAPLAICKVAKVLVK